MRGACGEPRLVTTRDHARHRFLSSRDRFSAQCSSSCPARGRTACAQLAPLGAARETLDPADWKSVIATWMERSALIVFIAPPERVSEGLLWELQAVSANRRWAKTLIVVPPVSPEQIQRRWQAFLIACARLWPFTYPLPAADPRVLVLAFRNNAWTLVTANRQTEWSYSAALKQAVDDSSQGGKIGNMTEQSI